LFLALNPQPHELVSLPGPHVINILHTITTSFVYLFYITLLHDVSCIWFLQRRIVKELVNTLIPMKYYGDDESTASEIAVLSQYKAQRSALIDDLKREGFDKCSVSTVIASQGQNCGFDKMSILFDNHGISHDRIITINFE